MGRARTCPLFLGGLPEECGGGEAANPGLGEGARPTLSMVALLGPEVAAQGYGHVPDAEKSCQKAFRQLGQACRRDCRGRQPIELFKALSDSATWATKP